MTHSPDNTTELTPVDDTRRVRERLDREAKGNIHVLAEQSRAAVEKYRTSLNLKLVSAPTRETREDGKTG